MINITQVVCLTRDGDALTVFDILQADIDATEAQSFFSSWVSPTDASHIIIRRGYRTNDGAELWPFKFAAAQVTPRSWRACQRYHRSARP